MPIVQCLEQPRLNRATLTLTEISAKLEESQTTGLETILCKSERPTNLDARLSDAVVRLGLSETPG